MNDIPSWVATLVKVVMVGLPALGGVALIGTAVRQWIRLRRLLTTGLRATATVVDNQLESRSDGQTVFRPVVTYRTSSGQEIRTVIDLPASRSHLTGSELEVSYDPDAPTDAAPTRKGGRGPATFAVLGVAFLVFAVCAYRAAGFIFDDSDFGDLDDFSDLDPA